MNIEPNSGLCFSWPLLLDFGGCHAGPGECMDLDKWHIVAAIAALRDPRAARFAALEDVERASHIVFAFECMGGRAHNQ